MNLKKWLIAIPLTLALALGVAACGSSDDDSGGSSSGGEAVSGQIAGAGASSQEAAMAAWIAGFQSDNPDATIAYDPVGSGGGREQFIAGGTDFGGTDSAMDETELADARIGERLTEAEHLTELISRLEAVGGNHQLAQARRVHRRSSLIWGLRLGPFCAT